MQITEWHESEFYWLINKGITKIIRLIQKRFEELGLIGTLRKKMLEHHV